MLALLDPWDDVLSCVTGRALRKTGTRLPLVGCLGEGMVQVPLYLPSRNIRTNAVYPLALFPAMAHHLLWTSHWIPLEKHALFPVGGGDHMEQSQVTPVVSAKAPDIWDSSLSSIKIPNWPQVQEWAHLWLKELSSKDKRLMSRAESLLFSLNCYIATANCDISFLPTNAQLVARPGSLSFCAREK